MSYEKQKQYAFEGLGFYGNTTRYYANAWNVTVTLSNSGPLEIDLGNTLIVLEESTEGGIFLAGSLTHDGCLESNHVWRLEERYALDSYMKVARSGNAREQPTIAGSSYGFVASETGEPLTGDFSMFIRKVDPWPSYTGYGFGTVAPSSSVTISQPILMGTGFKASYLRSVYVAVPGVYAQCNADGAAGRFILRFTPEAESTTAESTANEFHPPVHFVNAEFVPLRGDDLLAMASDGSRGIVERTLALNWLGELGDPLYEKNFTVWMNDRILPLLLRRAAAWHLSRIDTPTAHDALLQALANADTPFALRAACAAALAENKVEAAADSILALLSNPQTPPMPGFFHAARLLGDKRFGAPLAALLPLNTHTSMVSTIAWALSTTTDSNAVAPLAAAALKGSSDVSTKALHYLGYTRCAAAAEALRDLALRPTFTNQHQVIAALGTCNVPEAQAALIELLSSPSHTNQFYGIITALRPPADPTAGVSLFGRTRSPSATNQVTATWDRTPATDALAEFAGKQGTNQLQEVLRSLEVLPSTPKGVKLVELLLRATNAPSFAASGACDVVRAWRLSSLFPEVAALARTGNSNVVAAAVLAATELAGAPDENTYRDAFKRVSRSNWPNSFKLLTDDLLKRKPAWAGGLLTEQLVYDDSTTTVLETLAKLGDESAAVRDAVRHIAESDKPWTLRNRAVITLSVLRDPAAEWFEAMCTNRNLAVDARGACLLAIARSDAEKARNLLMPVVTNGLVTADNSIIDAIALVADKAMTDALARGFQSADETEVVKLAQALTATKDADARRILNKELLVTDYGEHTRDAIRRALAGEKPVRP